MQNFMDSAPWPCFFDDDLKDVADVLTSGKVNFWTGHNVKTFEVNFADYVQSQHAFAVANGTVSLDMVLALLELKPGDEVVVTPRTYFASVSSIVMAGGRPVFADICADSQNVTASSIEKVLTPQTRAIMPVHLAGWPCDMTAIGELAEAHSLAVIEDCAQAHGARFNDQHVGTFGLAGSFSFCQDKIMTTCGEGGMLTVNDSEFSDRLWSLRDHGKSRATVQRPDHPPGFRWVHESFGSNYRMTEMQAAVGINQLEKLNDWVHTRRAHAEQFNKAFAPISSLRLTLPADNIYHAYYKYYMFVRPESLKSGWSRDRIMAEVVEKGVPCFSGSCPEVYREKALIESGMAPAEPLPVAKELGETSLMLLVHPTMTEQHRQRTIDTVVSVMHSATRQSS